jgi:eukaryotic-like serine/threonine-protein kinase
MVGETISQYRVEEELGRGGMGVVYRAYDLRLRREVAIKLLAAEIANQGQRRERVLAEARAASSLNHPAIVTIYEVKEEDGRVFIVMELLRGRTLRSIVSGAPNDPRTLSRIGAQIADGLAAAHACGLIHGDIKPENVIVLEDGRVKLLDFGLARHTIEGANTLSSSTITTSAVKSCPRGGTLGYMAPEQLLGQNIDARTDLFSLGVVLYELAVGKHPFLRLSEPLVHQMLNATPVSPAASISAVPAEFSRIIDKLLEKEPERRYQSAREVRIDLINLGRDLELGPALPSAIAGRRSVAVLPLKLLTPSPEDQYLGVALADAIINRLSGTELLLRPTSAVQRYANQHADPFRAGRELNVQTVVEGSIQKFAQKLRVHIQAWNVADGTSCVSAKYDSDVSELFSLQDRIGEGLSRALGGRTPGEPRTLPPAARVNTAAYQLFLRAVERLSRLNRWDTSTAVEMLESATKLDPGFADAWARLAEACLLMAISFDPRPGWSRRADRAIRRALALDPANADAYSARGRLLWSPEKDFKHTLALRALNKALKLNPGCHQARLWRGVILNHIGFYAEARAEFASMLAVNPDDAYTLNQLAHMCAYLGNFSESEEYFARALTVDPSHLWANIFSVAPPMYSGDLDGAAERIRIARQVAGDDQFVHAWESLLWAKRGERRRALHFADLALKDKRYLTYTHHAYHQLAASYATLGKVEAAVALIEKASRTGLPSYPLYRDDIHFHGLRNESFRRLIGSLERQWQSHKREIDLHS